MKDTETDMVVEFSLPAAYSQGGFAQVRTVLMPSNLMPSKEGSPESGALDAAPKRPEPPAGALLQDQVSEV
jgi:hypothetical protein